MGGAERLGAVVASFQKQVGWCKNLHAPFTACVLEVLAGELGRGGTLDALIRDWPGDPVADALPLRVAGALHALVLTEQAPGLAACYPPREAGGALRPALLAALDGHGPFIHDFLRSPPQTNEVGRSAVLLGGFLQVAGRTGLPLRLLEIGASAGLNLIWDRYRYRIGGVEWGDPASPVLLAPQWNGPLPALGQAVTVAAREGCDIAPLDLADPGQCLRLRSYVWPDQPERLKRIEGAIALARGAGVAVERADAAEWVAGRLGSPAAGRATVLYHSIMWQYMAAGTQAALQAAICRAGAAATQDAPFAWLRFEPPGSEGKPQLRLTCWPDGVERLLAAAHPHGTTVDWQG